MVSRKIRKELDALSLEVFGSSSRWQKLVTKGHPEVVTTEVEEVVPADQEGTDITRKVQKPVEVGKNAYTYTAKYYTIESVWEYMTNQKRQLEEIRAEIKRRNDEARAKQEADTRLQRELEASSGSAT